MRASLTGREKLAARVQQALAPATKKESGDGRGNPFGPKVLPMY